MSAAVGNDQAMLKLWLAATADVMTDDTRRSAVRHDGAVPESELFISVDVETSGPTPSTGSLIAIGACPVSQPELAFYRELKADPEIPWDHRTEEAHGLTRTYLDLNGMD